MDWLIYLNIGLTVLLILINFWIVNKNTLLDIFKELGDKEFNEEDIEALVKLFNVSKEPICRILKLFGAKVTACD